MFPSEMLNDSGEIWLHYEAVDVGLCDMILEPYWLSTSVE